MLRIALPALTLLSAAAMSPPVAAGEIASGWQEALNSRARLIAGDDGNGDMFVGLQIELDEKWKTYWRNPGDAGIPPLFDFSSSRNLAGAQVLYPAPYRLPDAVGESVGYKNEVVFPVKIAANEPDRPIDVVLKVNYGVCEEICIPVDQEFTLQIPAYQEVATPQPLSASLRAVPKPATQASLPRIAALKLVEEAGKARVLIDVLYRQDAAAADLFAEGPDNWYLRLPRETARRETPQGLSISYALDLDTVPKGATIPGTALTFTMVAGDHGSEQVVDLPFAVAR